MRGALLIGVPPLSPILTVLDPKEEELLATSGVALSIYELRVLLGREEGDPEDCPLPCDTRVASWDRVPLLLPESLTCGSRAES